MARGALTIAATFPLEFRTWLLMFRARHGSWVMNARPWWVEPDEPMY
jgi:hypothetical protein